MIEPLDAAVLPPTIRARFIEGVNGLRVHVLEAGSPGDRLVLLLHGFPELAYSWRRILPALAQAGCHVVAPDVRGYGRTTGWERAYETDLAPFGLLNLVRDALALVHALEQRQVALLAGHDSGASIAAACALVRPDIFRCVVLMSAPFPGAPDLPLPQPPDLDGALAALLPPRKHYHDYYSTPPANADMQHPPQGLHDFMRAYYHHKSADWPGNQPARLPDASAQSYALLPTYYVMQRAATMPGTVAPEMPDAAQITACRWLTEAELAVYAGDYARTGFQGGLNWYRARTTGLHARELSTFAGRTIDIPSGFIAGRQDWGIYQSPGAFERMREAACTRMELCELIEGAGHWVQQERSEEVSRLLTGFLRQHAT